jgi:hypothetical protein
MGADVEGVAARLVALRALLPQADILRMVGDWPGLLRMGEGEAEAALEQVCDECMCVWWCQVGREGSCELCYLFCS